MCSTDKAMTTWLIRKYQGKITCIHIANSSIIYCLRKGSRYSPSKDTDDNWAYIACQYLSWLVASDRAHNDGAHHFILRRNIFCAILCWCQQCCVIVLVWLPLQCKKNRGAYSSLFHFHLNKSSWTNKTYLTKDRIATDPELSLTAIGPPFTQSV